MTDLKNSILSGVLSGSITAITFQPLEYIKTKLQQPNLNSKSTIGPKSIRCVIRNTLINETGNNINLMNLTKFWTGLTPSLVRSVPVAGIYFALIDFFKNSEHLSHSRHDGKYQMLHSFIIGALAKTIADTATFPLNLIKTRYESDFYSYKNLSNAFRTIIKTEGVNGLYKGLGATLVRDVGYSGVYFMLYTKVKSVLKNAELTGGESKTKKDPNKSVFFATCALTSSVFACCITQPPDVIRSYMQLHPNTYKSFVSTAKIIYAQNGVKGFFVGFLPRSARRVLISMITWTLYEKLTYKS